MSLTANTTVLGRRKISLAQLCKITNFAVSSLDQGDDMLCQQEEIELLWYFPIWGYSKCHKIHNYSCIQSMSLKIGFHTNLLSLGIHQIFSKSCKSNRCHKSWTYLAHNLFIVHVYITNSVFKLGRTFSLPGHRLNCKCSEISIFVLLRKYNFFLNFHPNCLKQVITE